MSDADLQRFFKDVGVAFPEGSFVTYNKQEGLLVFRNTHANLELVDRAIGSCPRPNQVTVETRFLQLPRSLAEDLFADDEGLSKACIIKEKILKRITELERKGKIVELARPKLTTVSGNTAQVKAVREHRYPSGAINFFPAKRSTNTIGAVSGVGSYGPASFETREIGSLLNATPTIGPDGSVINLTLVPEISAVAAKPREYSLSTSSGKVTVEQPEFSSYQTTTTVQLKSGKTMLLAVMDPVPSDGKIFQGDVVLVLLSATVVRE